jgi:ABC-type dipeptide/oligopeptide/nickel transport system ATPase component
MLLDVRNLTVRFPSSSGEVFAVRDVSFSIGQGEVLGLVGESGSGKSVTSLAAMGLLVPQARTSGEILFEGRDVLRATPDELRRLRGSRMAMIFQEPMTALNPVMRVGEQVAEAARAHGGVTRQEAWRRAVEALNAVAIPDAERRARDYPHQMSGGQRQRVMIAMALVNKPSLLIADEPTTALDVTVQAQILELMADLRRRFALAMLFISHDLAVVSQVSDRIAVMFGGRIVETGPARQVFLSPQHPYTKGLLESVPTLKTSRAKPLGTVEKSAKVNDGELVEVGTGHWVRRVQK